MLNIILMIILFSISILNLNAQNVKYGLFGEYGIDQTKADFNKLKDIPNCCPQFLDGSGNGISLGALVELPIEKEYGFMFRLSYTSFESKMLSKELTSVIVSNVIQSGEFNHTLNGTFSKVGLDPLFYYSIFTNFKINLGLRLAYNLSSKFEQKETIEGTYGSFYDINGKDTGRVRNEMYDKDIPNASAFSIYGLGGLSYDLPLNKQKSLLLSPSVFVYYNINSQVDDVSWNVNSIRPGLAIKYTPQEEIKIIKKIDEIRKIDTIYKELEEVTSNFNFGKESIIQDVKLDEEVELTTNYYSRTDTIFTAKEYRLEGKLEAFGIDSLGNEIKSAVFNIEEFVSNKLQPLLPYIFFDNNSSEIQNKYVKITKDEVSNFDFKQLSKYTTLETYYQILNIVGKRMVENSNAKLRIVGCNSGIGEELDNTLLSEKRATMIKEYFELVWGIDNSRLKVEKRQLPDQKSTPITDIDKMAENRRVELISDVYEITSPIFLYDTLRKANPPTARFYTSATTNSSLKNWTLNAKQNSSNKSNFEQSGNDILPKSFDWQLNNNQKLIPSLNQQIEVTLNLENLKGMKMSISSILPVNYISITKKRIEKINDMEISRYNLILFDFNKFDIKSNNQKIVDFIKKNLNPESKVKITGYTDKTGEAQLNLKLSQNRAQATKDILSHPNSTAVGEGNNISLFNNEYPEGRFYCRTVDIYVETPIK